MYDVDPQKLEEVVERHFFIHVPPDKLRPLPIDEHGLLHAPAPIGLMRVVCCVGTGCLDVFVWCLSMGEVCKSVVARVGGCFFGYSQTWANLYAGYGLGKRVEHWMEVVESWERGRRRSEETGPGASVA
jgi:hypothetical protein